MIVRATVTKGQFVKGVEYDLPDQEAQAMIIHGTMILVAVAPHQKRELAVKKQYEKR